MEIEPRLGRGRMADYYSIIAKAVSALDLNTEKARRRLYDRARSALRSGMHSAYPRFHRSETAAAEMSLEMAIKAVEAEAVREQNAKLATHATSPLRASVSVTPSPPANQNSQARHSLATLWGILCRAGDRTQGRGEAIQCEDGTDGGRTWLTELLARASHGGDNGEQDFTPRWAPTQNGGAN
jgi:hypothetical protein